MTIEQAKARIKKAMRIIVDLMLGENSDPSESYQTKYDIVDAVDDDVISTLRNMNVNNDAEVSEMLELGKHIKCWYESHVSFLLDEPRPERWMFRQ